jgi:uroporphyrinogen-III synthase
MKFWEEVIAYFPLIRHGPQENDASNIASIVAFVSVAAVTFLQSRCLATIVEQTHGLRTDGRIYEVHR